MKHLNFLFVILSIVLLSNVCSAQEASQELLAELAKVTGIYEQIEEQQKGLSAQSEQLGMQIGEQLVASLSELPPELKVVFQQEFEKYMQKCSVLIDPEASVNSYVKLISSKLSQQEVESVISFYKSDAGKNYTRANIEIANPWSMSMLEGLDQKVGMAAQELQNNLLAAINEYSKNEMPNTYQPPAVKSKDIH